jgi:outer membrane PBP1 activator LpoA protein
MTGLLSIDSKGHVRRELDWAQVAGGKANPLSTAAATAAN